MQEWIRCSNVGIIAKKMVTKKPDEIGGETPAENGGNVGARFSASLPAFLLQFLYARFFDSPAW
jgi:hypothetical protein